MFNVFKQIAPDPEAQGIFERGVAALGKNSKSVWLTYLKYHVVVSEDDVIEDLYKKACQSFDEVSIVIKPFYLEWAFVVYGTKKAREVYREIATRKPFLLELHKMMVKFEYIELNPDFEHWESVHKLAVEQFPEPDVWLNYIEFLIDDKKSDKSYIEEIYNKAIKSLPDVQRDIFKHEFTKLLAKKDS